METHHGEIRIYDNGKAVAYCSVHCNKCQKKKELRESTLTKKGTLRRPGQGRPLGFLYCWLAKGAKFVNSKHHHKRFKTTFAKRAAHRLGLEELPESTGIWEFERPQPITHGIIRASGEPTCRAFSTDHAVARYTIS